MGKGEIASGGTAGLYQITVRYNSKKFEKMVAAMAAKIAQLEAEILALQTELAAREAEYAATPTIDLEIEIGLFESKIEYLKLEKLSAQKRKDQLESRMPDDEEVSAWCADLTTDLSGVIGTVEVPGERGILQVQPGWQGNAAYTASRDGQLFPSIELTDAQIYYSTAMMPGWQKWMPTFRHGKVSNLDHATNSATVTLEDYTTEWQGLDINQATIINGVNFDYMNCDSLAFVNGDDVLVKFTDQKFTSPLIIGFKDHPQGCMRVYPYIGVTLAEYGGYGFLLCKGDEAWEFIYDEVTFAGEYEHFSAFGDTDPESLHLPYEHGTEVYEWQLDEYDQGYFHWSTIPWMDILWEPIWCSDHGGALDCDYNSKPYKLEMTTTINRSGTDPSTDYWGYYTYTRTNTIVLTGTSTRFAQTTYDQWWIGDNTYDTEIGDYPVVWHSSGSNIKDAYGVVSQSDPSKYLIVYMTYNFEGSVNGNNAFVYGMGYAVEPTSIWGETLVIEGLGHKIVVPTSYGSAFPIFKLYEMDNGKHVALFTLHLPETDGNLDHNTGVYTPRSEKKYIGAAVEDGAFTLLDVTNGLDVAGQLVDVMPSSSDTIFGFIIKN